MAKSTSRITVGHLFVKSPKICGKQDAYIADALCAALVIRKGKWVIFEKFWSLNNGAQLAGNLRSASKGNPTEHQRHIAKLLRKGARLRPKLDTCDLGEFKKP